jgi:chromosome segregation ATPase
MKIMRVVEMEPLGWQDKAELEADVTAAGEMRHSLLTKLEAASEARDAADGALEEARAEAAAAREALSAAEGRHVAALSAAEGRLAAFAEEVQRERDEAVAAAEAVSGLKEELAAAQNARWTSMFPANSCLPP